jgi:hypothetical protein
VFGGVVKNNVRVTSKFSSKATRHKPRVNVAVPAQEEISWVLEHVSSPFRWELIEIPTVLPVPAENNGIHNMLKKTGQ